MSEYFNMEEEFYLCRLLEATVDTLAKNMLINLAI